MEVVLITPSCHILLINSSILVSITHIHIATNKALSSSIGGTDQEIDNLDPDILAMPYYRH
ncbi:hypothetical protein PanWU01x14_105140 [Parasponia andersonii]|uniref:Uncharacterized protein n=1 Tax=Parasponia andersonii TaxID=3476 RepID=A0A2P5D1H4_PARAD|nr:hypothetical protein PanWU01x14_105140 [Parasponia andersonii]